MPVAFSTIEREFAIVFPRSLWVTLLVSYSHGEAQNSVQENAIMRLLIQGLRIIVFLLGVGCLVAGLRLLALALWAGFFLKDYNVIPTLIFGIIGALLTIMGIILIWIARRMERNLDIQDIQDALKRRVRRTEQPPIKWE